MTEEKKHKKINTFSELTDFLHDKYGEEIQQSLYRRHPPGPPDMTRSFLDRIRDMESSETSRRNRKGVDKAEYRARVAERRAEREIEKRKKAERRAERAEQRAEREIEKRKKIEQRLKRKADKETAFAEYKKGVEQRKREKDLSQREWFDNVTELHTSLGSWAKVAEAIEYPYRAFMARVHSYKKKFKDAGEP